MTIKEAIADIERRVFKSAPETHYCLSLSFRKDSERHILRRFIKSLLMSGQFRHDQLIIIETPQTRSVYAEGKARTLVKLEAALVEHGLVQEFAKLRTRLEIEDWVAKKPQLGNVEIPKSMKCLRRRLGISQGPGGKRGAGPSFYTVTKWRAA